MLASFRRLSKSTVGTIITVLFLLLIIASFAVADISSVVSSGFAGGGEVLARVGSEKVTDREMSRLMEQRLTQIQQQNPEASYSNLSGEFEQLLSALIDARVLEAFADKFGLSLSKRLIDAQIATIPGTRGLNGQFSEEAYASFLAQQRMTDAEVRTIVRNQLLQQLLAAPVMSNARMSVGLASPYASMLLERREGQVAFVPVAAFRGSLKPTPTDLERFYEANRARFMVPEQRVIQIAKMGPEQVANVTATDQEIAAYYKANQALYAAKDVRTVSQAVVPDQATARAIAARARAGASFAAAAAPAGLSAADVSVGPQTRAQFASLAGDQVAAAAFGAAEGTVVGPIQSDLGWHVVKVDQIRREGGKSLDEARAEIAAKLNADKRKEAIENLAEQVQTALDDGASFSEAAVAAKLAPIETPLITGTGASQTDPNYRIPSDLAPALKSGFDLAEGDQPSIDPLPNDGGYVLVAPARIVPAAPAPLASIRERVAADWVNAQAAQRARQLAQAIASKANQVPLQEAVKGTPVQLPSVAPVSGQRIQLSQFQGRVPPPIGMLFSLGQNKARMVAGTQGEGFYVVKVNRIIPGNALNQPSLIGQTQQQLQQALSEEYAEQFLGAARSMVGIKRNERAIATTKARIISGGS